MLIQNGAACECCSVEEKYKWTALHFAAHECCMGHVDVAKVLIQNGVDVNAVDEVQRDGTSLRIAIWMLTL